LYFFPREKDWIKYGTSSPNPDARCSQVVLDFSPPRMWGGECQPRLRKTQIRIVGTNWIDDANTSST
jgi:hypothetical protein